MHKIYNLKKLSKKKISGIDDFVDKIYQMLWDEIMTTLYNLSRKWRLTCRCMIQKYWLHKLNSNSL